MVNAPSVLGPTQLAIKQAQLSFVLEYIFRFEAKRDNIEEFGERLTTQAKEVRLVC